MRFDQYTQDEDDEFAGMVMLGYAVMTAVLVTVFGLGYWLYVG